MGRPAGMGVAVDSTQKFRNSASTTILTGILPAWHRCSGNGSVFDELSALTQLTRLQIDYTGSLHREMLCSQLAQLTGLRELNAPAVMQADGGNLVRSYFLTMLRTACAAGAQFPTLASSAVTGMPAARSYMGSTPHAERHRSWGTLLCASKQHAGGCRNMSACCLCRCHCAHIALQADVPCGGGARLRHR